MARLRSFKQAAETQAVHPTETDAEWSIVESSKARLLQISTFGSEHRASHPKVSPTFQVDRERAALLRDAIYLTFPDLAASDRATSPSPHIAPASEGVSIVRPDDPDAPEASDGSPDARQADNTRRDGHTAVLDASVDEWASTGRADERVTSDLSMLVCIIRVLAGTGDSMDSPSIRLMVIDALGTSMEEFRVIRHASVVEPEFDYRFRWALTWAARTPFVDRESRGRYRISSDGMALIDRHHNIEDEVLSVHRDLEAQRRRRKGESFRH